MSEEKHEYILTKEEQIVVRSKTNFKGWCKTGTLSLETTITKYPMGNIEICYTRGASDRIEIMTIDYHIFKALPELFEKFLEKVEEAKKEMGIL